MFIHIYITKYGRIELSNSITNDLVQEQIKVKQEQEISNFLTKITSITLNYLI